MRVMYGVILCFGSQLEVSQVALFNLFKAKVMDMLYNFDDSKSKSNNLNFANSKPF